MQIRQSISTITNRAINGGRKAVAGITTTAMLTTGCGKTGNNFAKLTEKELTPALKELAQDFKAYNRSVDTAGSELVARDTVCLFDDVIKSAQNGTEKLSMEEALYLDQINHWGVSKIPEKRIGTTKKEIVDKGKVVTVKEPVTTPTHALESIKTIVGDGIFTGANKEGNFIGEQGLYIPVEHYAKPALGK